PPVRHRPARGSRRGRPLPISIAPVGPVSSIASGVAPVVAPARLLPWGLSRSKKTRKPRREFLPVVFTHRVVADRCRDFVDARFQRCAPLRRIERAPLRLACPEHI